MTRGICPKNADAISLPAKVGTSEDSVKMADPGILAWVPLVIGNPRSCLITTEYYLPVSTGKGRWLTRGKELRLKICRIRKSRMRAIVVKGGAWAHMTRGVWRGGVE